MLSWELLFCASHRNSQFLLFAFLHLNCPFLYLLMKFLCIEMLISFSSFSSTPSSTRMFTLFDCLLSFMSLYISLSGLSLFSSSFLRFSYFVYPVLSNNIDEICADTFLISSVLCFFSFNSLKYLLFR